MEKVRSGVVNRERNEPEAEASKPRHVLFRGVFIERPLIRTVGTNCTVVVELLLLHGNAYSAGCHPYQFVCSARKSVHLCLITLWPCVMGLVLCCAQEI